MLSAGLAALLSSVGVVGGLLPPAAGLGAAGFGPGGGSPGPAACHTYNLIYRSILYRSEWFTVNNYCYSI